MLRKFSQYVTKHEKVSGYSGRMMASFCHFDARNQIADYVVFYVKSLHELGANVFFVSNCERIEDEELAKIRPYVTEIILRQNVGYDFACYFTGYMYGRAHQYETVIFVNDSCYGPFYPLMQVFEKMQGLDMWGISDAYAGRYHIQSNFWVFNNMKYFLDKAAEEFEFISVKEQVVGRYEEGLTQKIIDEGFKTGVLCDNKKVAKFEANAHDPVLLRLKANIRQIAQKKINLARKTKGILLPSARKRNREKVEHHTCYTGIFSNWYTMVKYFGCPLIKVGMLKKPNMARYHDNEYIELLKNKYPAYDWQMIEKHLGKI